MDAGNRRGELTTRKVQFIGSRLFINVEAPQGEVRAEVLDVASGKPLRGFSLRDCLPVRGDKTLAPVAWKNGRDLGAIAGRPVRIRFQLRNARLYSFWVSASESGASRGFVGGGGPGFEHSYDDAGMAAYRAAEALSP
jgi:hypothetical protein